MSAVPRELWTLAPLQPGDVPRILEIERRAYPFPWTDGIFRDCLKVGYSSWMVVGPQGEVLSYALMSMAAGEAHILNLCVEPDYQGQGLGRFMLEHLLCIARNAGMTLILLEVRRSNARARRLYEGAGFSTFGVRKAYYPAVEGREDALVLGIDIT